MLALIRETLVKMARTEGRRFTSRLVSAIIEEVFQGSAWGPSFGNESLARRNEMEPSFRRYWRHLKQRNECVDFFTS